MKLVHRREIIANVPEQWARQYATYSDEFKFAGGGTVGDVKRRLFSAKSREEIQAVLPHWCENRCDECGKDCETLVRLGSEPDYDARWQDLCIDCCERAVAVLRGDK